MELEKVNLKDIIINQLLDKKFIDEIKKMEADLDAVSIVIMPKDPKSAPIIISHETAKDISDKKVHIICPDGHKLEQVAKILKELGAK